MRRNWRSIPLILVLVALTATLARADVVHLKNGKSFEGKIVSETSKVVKIKTRFGDLEFKRDQIERIEKGKTPKEEYRERKAKLDKKDVNGLFELALFCKEKKLTKEYRALLKDILKVDKQHDGANTELGHIKYDGQWFTAEALEEYKALEKQRMEEIGMVLYNGKWMTEEEAMEARGYVLVDGQWLTRADADRLRAARDFEEVFGVPLTISDSENFSIRNTRTDEDNQYLLDICEEAFAHFVELAEPTPKEMEFLTHYDYHIYILEEPQHCNMFIESGYIDRYTPPKNTKERYLDSTNFSYFFPMPVIVLSEGRHLKSGGDRETALIGMTMIHLGQTFIRRLKRGGGLPSWAEAGMAHYFEGEFNSYSTVSVVEYPHYEPYVDKWIDGWETFPRWHEKLADPTVLAGLPSLTAMNEIPVEELKVDSLAKSWSLVKYLMANRRKEFFDFARKAKIKWRGERITTTEAFDKIFAGITPEQIESEWREWLKNPRAGVPKREAGGVLR